VDTFTLNKVEFDAVRRILARFCATSPGKSLAGRIGPSRNPETIHRWLDQTSQMIEAVRDVGPPPLAGLTDISGALHRATPGGGAGGEDFAAIASVLEAAGAGRAYLNSLPEKLELLRAMGAEIGEFDAELAAIRSIVHGDGTIRDDASKRLTGIRDEIEKVAQHIHDVIYGYLRQGEVAKLLQNVTVTLHGDRFVLPVKAANRGRLPGVVHRESNTGATVFVEPEASVELNNRLADLHNDDRVEVRRLLSQLSLRLQGRIEPIASAVRILSRVDLLSAKAQYAYQFDMTRPEVSENGPLQFIDARHPLLTDQAWRAEQAGREHPPVVPVSVRLGSDFDLLVVTGSNTGGKTVTLKTVALLALMAQSGLHVPAARGATMPAFHDVFIDIGDEQSLEQSLSTFGAHIKRITYILRKAGRSSLVLLDELGAGTDPDEGGAIGQSILDELGRIKCVGMVTTHLSVLKAYAFARERVENASVEFDTATMTPTYHLQIGTPGESHAITVAQKLGMPRRLMSAARRHLSGQGEQFLRAIRATNIVRKSAESARREAHDARQEAESQQEVYQAKLADLHRLQGEFETWLASLSDWKAGDEVHVPSLGKTGRLVRLELHRQMAIVDADNMQVEVPLRELMPNLGQSEIRDQIATMRRQILDQASRAQDSLDQARRERDQFHRAVQQQKQRGRQFDRWLGAIGRVKIGDEVPIARKPGVGKVVKLDFTALRVTVDTPEGQLSLSIQELFPQTGPFAARDGGGGVARARPGAKGEKGEKRAKRPPDRPIRRRSADSKAAHKNRQALLDTPPGEQVFVVPFNKRATLIRIDKGKSQATVQSGIFEMEIPLADLEPVRGR